MPQSTINKQGMSEFEDAIAKMMVGFMEDLVSVAQDNINGPRKDNKGNIADTGQLGRSFRVSGVERNANELYIQAVNDAPYGRFVELGTEPFNAKLIEWTLTPDAIKELGGYPWQNKRTRVVVSSASSQVPEFEVGQVLAPVFIDWVSRKLGIRDEVKQYDVAWSIYRKIQREGIDAQHFFMRAVTTMQEKGAIERHFSTEGIKVELR